MDVILTRASLEMILASEADIITDFSGVLVLTLSRWYCSASTSIQGLLVVFRALV